MREFGNGPLRRAIPKLNCGSVAGSVASSPRGELDTREGGDGVVREEAYRASTRIMFVEP